MAITAFTFDKSPLRWSFVTRGISRAMQPRVHVAALIFLASYLPLAMILALQDFDLTPTSGELCQDWAHALSACTVPMKHPLFATAPVAVCLVSLFITLTALASVKPGPKIIITSAKHVPADLMNYTLPYIVSFMSLDYGDHAKLAGFAVFLVWILIITMRSGQLLMNPVLTVFGWQLYEIEFTYMGGTGGARAGIALVKGGLDSGKTVAQQAVQDIQIIKKGW